MRLFRLECHNPHISRSNGSYAAVSYSKCYNKFNKKKHLHCCFPQLTPLPLSILQHHFGNPSSIHTYGTNSKQALDTARNQVAALINAPHPSSVIFTSCGTESDTHAIWGAITAWKKKKTKNHAHKNITTTTANNDNDIPHIITSTIEHPAVLEYLKSLEEMSLITWSAVGVDSKGVVNAQDVEAELVKYCPQNINYSIIKEGGGVNPLALVTIMHSNNEVGSIQPIAEISTICKKYGVLFHTDAAQSIGKTSIDIQSLGADMMTIVGHKFGAPKGIAALYIAPGTDVGSLLHGGSQEFQRRAGTENIPYCVALGAACVIVKNELDETMKHMCVLRARLLDGMKAALGDVVPLHIHGPIDDDDGDKNGNNGIVSNCRLPNTLSISISCIIASELLRDLKDKLAASSGAACHSGHSGGATVSSVLRAMGVGEEVGVGTIRFSVGRHTTEDDVDRGVELISGYVLDKMMK